jgi:3-deoxy-manno-octulosonate cytidylyltransferase (CMP-KDO synthetase)
MSNSPTIVAMIPARLGSTRFPEKVLASRTGKPLIQHVYENALRAKRPARVVIATDHERVRAACAGFGAEVVMTDEAHPNGTSRLAQAARVLGLGEADIVVNVQGDEPEMEPGVIDACVDAIVTPASRDSVEMATVASPWNPEDDPANPAIVKVVTTQPRSKVWMGQGTPGVRALYFSRSRVPFPRNAPGPDEPLLRHVGIYAYRNRFLQRYITLESTPLERIESLEQLRVLEHGFAIGVAIVESRGTGIDTPEQYEAFVRRCNERRT